MLRLCLSFALNSMKKALLIEQDSDLRASLTMFLELANFAVVDTQDSVTGLQQAIALQPELIFFDLDISLAEGHGILYAFRSQRKTANIPVIFIGENITDDINQELLNLGASGCIGKPFNFIELWRLGRKKLPELKLIDFSDLMGG